MRKFVLGIVFFLVLSLGIVLKSPLFRINKVELATEGVDCLDDRIGKLSDERGVNIFTFDQEGLIRKITKAYICVKDVKLDKYYPNTLAVKLSPRVPVALIRVISDSTPPIGLNDSSQEATPSSQSAKIETLDSGSVNNLESSVDKLFLSDERGFLYSEASEGAKLPEIIFLGEGGLESNIGDVKIQNTLQIFRTLAQLGLSYQNPVVEGDYLLINSTNPKKIFFNLSSNVARELASLQLILQKSKIISTEVNSSALESIDLRFEKPVVVYAPRK